MSKYDKERQALGMKTSGNSMPTQTNTGSKYQKEREAIQSGTTLEQIDRSKYADAEKSRKEQKLKELNSVQEPSKLDAFQEKAKETKWYEPKVGLVKDFLKLDQSDKQEVANKATEDMTKSPLYATADAAADSATLGIRPVLQKAIFEKIPNGEDYLQKKKETKGNNPVAHTAGTVLGYVAPGAAVEKLASKTLTPILTNVGSRIGQKAIFGAVTGGGMELAEGLIRGDSPEDLANRTAVGAALGGIGDAAVYGIGKGAEKIIGKLKAGNTLTKAEKQLVNSINNAPELSKQANNDVNQIGQALTQPEAKTVLKSITEPYNINTLDNTKLKQLASEKGINPNQTKSQLRSALKETQPVGKIEPILTKLDEAQQAPSVKTSQFRTNTIERSTMIPNELKTDLNPNEFDYIVESSKYWQSQALKNVANNREKVINDIINATSISGGTQVHEAAIITSDLIDEVRKTNDSSALKSWLKTVSEKTRETARALKGTDTAWDKKSAEGALTDAQRVVDKVEKNIKKTNPAKIKKVNEETKKVTDAIESIKEQVGKQIEEEIAPEKLLSNKIQSTLKEAKTKDNNPVTDMVDELFKSAKESPLPERVATAKKNPIEFLTQAIQNKGQYSDVWDKAKDLLKSRYANNPDALLTLENFFNKDIVPTYSQNTLNRSVQTSVKGLGQKLNDIARSSKGDKQKALEQLTGHLISTTGATAEDATLLAQKVQARYEELLKEKSDSILRQMFKDVPVKSQKNMFEKVNELINLGAYDDSAFRDLIKQKEGLPTLDDTDIKFIIDNMDKAKTLGDGSYEQRMLHAKVAKLIADKIPSSFGEKFQAAQRISMLLNPKTTIVRNPLGNILLGTLEDTKNIVATPIDKLVSGIRKSERTTTLSPLLKSKANMEGAKKGLKEWALDIKNGIDTSPTGGQVEMPKNKIFSENHNIENASIKSVADMGGKVANKVHGVVGKMLQIGDRPFYEAAYASRIAELKKIKNTDIITDAMKEDAIQYAFERTLQNDSALAEMFTGLKKGNFISGDHAGAKSVYQFVANLVMPFAKTPANILDKFIDYSPLGSAKALGHAIGTAGKGTFNQKKFVDTMARSLTGTGLSMLGYLMAQKGLITGARDKNNKVEGIEIALGKQNYAFKVGDKYYTYDWGLPAAAPLAMGADIYNAVNNTKEGQNALFKGTESAINLLFNSTLLKGPSGFTGGYSPAVALGQGLLGTTTQATPTAGKQIAQLIDPYIRETYDPNTFKRTLNKTVARIPFASKTLPAKVDVFGNEIKAFQGNNNIWSVMFNPGFSTTYKPDEVQKEIIRLYNDSGLTDQLPTLADKYISETKQHPRINLTSDEFVQYQKRIGQLTTLGFKDVINSPTYRSADLSDEVKAKLLRSVVEDSKKQAKNEILDKRGYAIR